MPIITIEDDSPAPGLRFAPTAEENAARGPAEKAADVFTAGHERIRFLAYYLLVSKNKEGIETCELRIILKQLLRNVLIKGGLLSPGRSNPDNQTTFKYFIEYPENPSNARTENYILKSGAPVKRATAHFSLETASALEGIEILNEFQQTTAAAAGANLEDEANTLALRLTESEIKPQEKDEPEDQVKNNQKDKLYFKEAELLGSFVSDEDRMKILLLLMKYGELTSRQVYNVLNPDQAGKDIKAQKVCQALEGVFKDIDGLAQLRDDLNLPSSHQELLISRETAQTSEAKITLNRPLLRLILENKARMGQTMNRQLAQFLDEENSLSTDKPSNWKKKQIVLFAVKDRPGVGRGQRAMDVLAGGKPRVRQLARLLAVVSFKGEIPAQQTEETVNESFPFHSDKGKGRKEMNQLWCKSDCKPDALTDPEGYVTMPDRTQIKNGAPSVFTADDEKKAGLIYHFAGEKHALEVLQKAANDNSTNGNWQQIATDILPAEAGRNEEGGQNEEAVLTPAEINAYLKWVSVCEPFFRSPRTMAAIFFALAANEKKASLNDIGEHLYDEECQNTWGYQRETLAKAKTLLMIKTAIKAHEDEAQAYGLTPVVTINDQEEVVINVAAFNEMAQTRIKTGTKALALMPECKQHEIEPPLPPPPSDDDSIDLRKLAFLPKLIEIEEGKFYSENLAVNSALEALANGDYEPRFVPADSEIMMTGKYKPQPGCNRIASPAPENDQDGNGNGKLKLYTGGDEETEDPGKIVWEQENCTIAEKVKIHEEGGSLYVSNLDEDGCETEEPKVINNCTIAFVRGLDAQTLIEAVKANDGNDDDDDETADPATNVADEIRHALEGKTVSS